MKNALALALTAALAAPAAQAASARLSPQQSLALVESLLLAGAKADTSKPVYRLELRDLSCESRYVSHSGDPEMLHWGMRETRCAKPGAKGAAALLLVETLDKVEEEHAESLVIRDCAMGRCLSELKHVSCTIDSREHETEKRFACEIEDLQS